MVVKVERLRTEDLSKIQTESIDSHSMREIVERTRSIQQKRMSELGYSSEHKMTLSEIQKHGCFSQESLKFLSTASEKLKLSTRSYLKILKISRTIADMEESSGVEISHMLEALSYRR